MAVNHIPEGYHSVTPYLTVTMTYDRDAADGRTPGTVSVVHQRNDGTCEFPPRDCDTNEGFCFDARWEGHGANIQLVIENTATIFQSPGPRIAIMAIASRTKGKARWRSTRRMTRLSTIPPTASRSAPAARR